jgi:hypothetical protein
MSLAPLNLRVLLRRKDKDSGFGLAVIFLAFCHAEERSISLVIPVMSFLLRRKDKDSGFRFALYTDSKQSITQVVFSLNI